MYWTRIALFAVGALQVLFGLVVILVHPLNVGGTIGAISIGFGFLLLGIVALINAVNRIADRRNSRGYPWDSPPHP